jgi:hypothetical protein
LPAFFVEIGHGIAAPYAGIVLGELGVEVIKVSPAIRNSIPSVVMDDGTLSPVLNSPIVSPINAHAPNLFGRRSAGTKTGAYRHLRWGGEIDFARL